MQKCLKFKKTAKGDNQENKQARVIHLVYSVSVHVGLHSYKVSFKYIEKFWSYRAYTKIWEKCKGKSLRK